jgi:uncharacterized protein YukE
VSRPGGCPENCLDESSRPFLTLCIPDRVLALEESLQQQRVETEEVRKEAEATISGWQAHSETLMSKCAELESECASLRQSLDAADTSRQAQTQSTEMNEMSPENVEMDDIEELRAKLVAKEEELRVANESFARDEDVVQQWSGTFDPMTQRDSSSVILLTYFAADRVNELETTVHELEKQLEEQAKEANEAISGWQESFTEAESKYEKLESEANDLRESLESLSSELEKARQPESSPMPDFSAEIKELKSTLAEREEELRVALESLSQGESVVQQWSGKMLDPT